MLHLDKSCLLLAGLAMTCAARGAFAQDAATDIDEPSILAEEAAKALDPNAFDPTRPSPLWKGWSGGVELGLNGSSGNTDRFNFRVGVNGSRETDFNLTVASFTYSYATENGNETQNRARLDARNDFKIGDTRWSIFAQGAFDYDEFQDWDLRIAAFVGVGYRLIDTEKTRLNLRAGVGAQREIGGSNNKIRPEALLGADFFTQLTAKQKLTASVDVFPSLDRGGEFRSTAKAAWEILLDEEANLSLKIGVENRYDSQAADGFKKNDFDYYALLVFSF